MSNPRIRRLSLDYEELRTRFHQWAPIEVTALAGDPPERYRVVYHISGLYSTPSGQILERKEHVVEINLSLGYPRRAPQCRMLTPIFHPNFDEVSVCIGDFWAASEGLDDLVVRIGRMIAYQEYNVRSPLNGLAAKWAEQNAPRLPVDSTELAPPSRESASVVEDKVVVSLGGEVEPEAPRFSPPPRAVVSPAVVPPPPVIRAPVTYTPITGTPIRRAPILGTPVPISALPGTPLPTPPSLPQKIIVAPLPAVSLEHLRIDFGSIAIALPEEKRLTVGSLPGNDIILPYPSVSGFHAELIRGTTGLIVRDLGSTNGTLKNAVPVTETHFAPGDLLSFGKVEATVVSGF